MPRLREFETRLIDGLAECGVAADTPLLVAVSGGPDSMALLAGLMNVRTHRPNVVPELFAAHFNHRLRGPESEGDARYVTDFCREHGISCDVGTGDVETYRKDNGLSLEAAARQMRYSFLADVALRRTAQAVATAHTLDDQAETVLLHIARGSGIRGLAGIRPRTLLRHGETTLTTVRPMLRIRKSDAEQYCKEIGIRPRRDSSNDDLSIPRNRIRHIVLSELANINSDIVSAISRLAEAAASDSEWIDAQVELQWAHTNRIDADGSVSLDRNELLQLESPIATRLIQRAWETIADTPHGLEAAHVEALIAAAHGRTGAQIDLPSGVIAAVEYDSLRISRLGTGSQCPYPESISSVDLTVPGTARLGGHELVAAESPFTDTPNSGQPSIVFVDATAVGNDLTIRSRRAGDRFQPLGMTGEKKLQDFFVDERVPREWRDRIPLVESPRGIAWVAGYRPAHWARIRPETERVFRLELRKAG